MPAARKRLPGSDGKSHAKTSPSVLDPQIFQRFRINAQAFKRLFRGGLKGYDGLGEVCSLLGVTKQERYCAKPHEKTKPFFSAPGRAANSPPEPLSRERQAPVDFRYALEDTRENATIECAAGGSPWRPSGVARMLCFRQSR